MSEQDQQMMAALFGPPARYSDHKAGETIRFRLRGQEVSGLITYVAAAGDTATGKHAPVTYVCAVEGELMLVLVYQSELLQDN